MLDATNYSVISIAGKSRGDTAARMRHAHDAAAHDKWFRAQVEIGIQEADDPNTPWVSHEEAKASWAKKRAELVKRIEGNAA
jgi:hypothetical protein